MTPAIEESPIESIPLDVDLTALYIESFDPLDINYGALNDAEFFVDATMM